MCQLHFICNPKGTIGATDINFLKSKLRSAANFNSDGWGLFGSVGGQDKVSKKAEKFEDADLSGFIGAKFIVGHNRLATSGLKDENNTHPIVLENVIIAHNGIVAGRGNKQKSDTWKIAMSINAQAGVIDEVKLLESVFSRESGSFSIFVYFRKTGHLYYFKNESTEFMFKLLQRHNGQFTIVGATKCNNYELVTDKVMFGFTLKRPAAKLIAKMTPQANVIYQVHYDDSVSQKLGIDKVGTVTPKKIRGGGVYVNYLGQPVNAAELWGKEDFKDDYRGWGY
jgi:hypothetical protein